MANNRLFPSLGDLAFKALISSNREEISVSPYEHDVLMRYKQKHDNELMLNAIANADLNTVKEMLDENPLLAALTFGTVTTCSGNTFKDVSAIQLAYLMNDTGICNLLFQNISQLSKHLKRKAYYQLYKKMEEVKTQKSEFEPYDYSVLVNAITNDNMLKNNKNPKHSTVKSLDLFKEYLKPKLIKVGKPLIIMELLEAYNIFNLNWNLWNIYQKSWFLIKIIGNLLLRVEKCSEFEFSQGLMNIVVFNKTFKRDAKIVNKIKGCDMTYRSSLDSTLSLGRDYFVDIYFGEACCKAGLRPNQLKLSQNNLDKLEEEKDSKMVKISDRLYQSSNLTQDFSEPKNPLSYAKFPKKNM